MWTSCPSSTKTTAMPVSWQMGSSRASAKRKFSSRSPRMAFPTGERSLPSAFTMASCTSTGRWQLAWMHRSRTVRVISSQLMSLITALPFLSLVLISRARPG